MEEMLPAGAYDETTVRINTSFVAADGSPIYATEEWSVFNHDERDNTYMAYEVGGSGGVVPLSHVDLCANATIIDHA